MSEQIKVVGNLIAGEEIKAFLHSWAEVLCQLNIEKIAECCAADVSFFDASCQMQGLMSYQKMWEFYSDYFREGLKVFRREVVIHTDEHLAFVHCYSMVDQMSGVPTPGNSWCRSSMGLRKAKGKWRIVHQHVSVPVDLVTHQSKPIHF